MPVHKVSAISKQSFVITGVFALGATVLGISTTPDNWTNQLRMPSGQAQLVKTELLPELAGSMCELEPASAESGASEEASPFLLAAQYGARSSTSAQASRGLAYPNQAKREEVARRKPVRMLRDPYSAYSAVAVDVLHDEVVMTDENLFSILYYNRTENTPPNATLSEPKRRIQGMNAELEFQCALYVDPKSGDVYALNNDTLGKMVVFPHGANGDIAPARTLITPPFTFGIAVSEEHNEMMMTAQDDASVVTFEKSAKDMESPLRTLQGPKTQLADPHGITFDPASNLIYVTNWGTFNVHKRPDGSSDVETTGRGAGRKNFPIPRSYSIRGSGDVHPPSINIYPREAGGDTPPLRMIQGPKTQLNWPTAISVDSKRGEIFVANDTTHAINVYSANATGDVAPIRVLSGPKTLIKNPTGVYYDPAHDELWVTNFGNHSATVYKPNSSGNTAPLRVVRSGPLESPAPMMSNPHVVVYDGKRDQILVAN
ncbi:MAG: hypothetical protein EXQ56_13235 [Acidobacteria bacterium]|nr:hypothetical protein [Acidobacteriota bacterium]